MWSVIAALAVVAWVVGSYIWVVTWIERDAVRRGVTNGMPTLAALILGPIAAVAWLFMRPPLR
jgi:hypothetical protein